MKVYEIQTSERYPISLQAGWAFYSDPGNLTKLTPPELAMEITGGTPEPMFAGQIITYRLKAIGGLRMNWVTEITQVNPHSYFVDEQRFGPYRFWHHEHRFEEIDGGLAVTDHVHYAMPFGPLGRVVHAVLVQKQLQRIFAFRRKILETTFGLYTKKEEE
jgi:ligand-binding SRPBCC domain-containing protein